MINNRSSKKNSRESHSVPMMVRQHYIFGFFGVRKKA